MRLRNSDQTVCQTASANRKECGQCINVPGAQGAVKNRGHIEQATCNATFINDHGYGQDPISIFNSGNCMGVIPIPFFFWSQYKCVWKLLKAKYVGLALLLKHFIKI